MSDKPLVVSNMLYCHNITQNGISTVKKEVADIKFYHKGKQRLKARCNTLYM
jgi:aspartate carbamoyltransferase regulatory subunit